MWTGHIPEGELVKVPNVAAPQALQRRPGSTGICPGLEQDNPHGAGWRSAAVARVDLQSGQPTSRSTALTVLPGLTFFGGQPAFPSTGHGMWSETAHPHPPSLLAVWRSRRTLAKRCLNIRLLVSYY